MCMDYSERIESKEVPKYAYKVYRTSSDLKGLLTYFRYKFHEINKFNKSKIHKKTINQVPDYDQETFLHFGRISVFENKEDALEFSRGRNKVSYFSFIAQTWMVEVKQTTKYAYKGFFNGCKSFAVDQVKPIERVR